MVLILLSLLSSVFAPLEIVRRLDLVSIVSSCFVSVRFFRSVVFWFGSFNPLYFGSVCACGRGV